MISLLCTWKSMTIIDQYHLQGDQFHMRTRWPATATADQYASVREVHLVSLRP